MLIFERGKEKKKEEETPEDQEERQEEQRQADFLCDDTLLAPQTGGGTFVRLCARYATASSVVNVDSSLRRVR